MFKKKSLKFTYGKVSRDLRHAEALKTRETSRFKRLSIVRSINDSEFLENSVETPKENKVKAAAPKLSSRLEMLFKWKKEKEMKKEMEKLSKKKPFYAGNKNVIENKTSQILKSSFKEQTTLSFNSSKSSKSKLVTPCATIQPSRIQNPRKGITPSSTIQPSKVPNSKQGIAPSSTIQPSKVPYSKQTTTPSSTIQPLKVPKSKQFTPGTSQSSRLPNPKQFISGASQASSKFPNPKQNNLPKSGTNLSRSNSTTVLPRKFPLSAVDKTSTLTKPAVGLTRSNSSAAVSKKFPVSSLATDKTISSKAAVQKAPIVKRTNMPASGIAVKSKDLSKPFNKGLLESKLLPKSQAEKPIKKVGIGLSKFTSSAVTTSKQIPVQNKDASQSNKNVLSRKGFCFRTAVANASHQKADILLKTPMQGTPKKISEKISKQEKTSFNMIADQSLDIIPDVTFNSDISMIKPVRKSFAPVNFTFQPPEGLNFVFDDDYDVYQDLEEVKLQFMSRTSTPNKSSGSNSGVKSSKESLGSNNSIPNVGKTADLSNSIDIHISELMTPRSSEEEIEKKEADKIINKQTCNPVTSDISAEIKKSNSDVDHQISVKETDIAEIQDACEKITLVSPMKSEIKAVKSIKQQYSPEVNSDVNKDLNNSEHEKLASFSISQKSSEYEIDNEELDELINKQACNPVACDIITNTVIKNSTIGQNHQISIKETDITEMKEACKEKTSNSPIKTESKAVEDINQQNNKQGISSIVSQDLNCAKHEKLASVLPVKDTIATDCTETAVKNSEVLKSLFDETQPFDNCNIFENSEINTVKMTSNENISVNTGTSEKKAEDFVFFDADESLLDSIDLSKMMVQSDDEDTDENEAPSVQIPNCLERKSNGAIPKRISMLKRMSVMNSIAEINETDECLSTNPEKFSKSHDAKHSPRRSKRLSKLMDAISDSPVKNSLHNTTTPRRSLRLMQISTASDSHPVSPFQEKNTNVNSRRRSVRLIDLNTPEKAACEKLLGENFENLDPNNFLIDFESPTMPALPSRKVSLLYSPERRKSIRKSIKGDLMSFSPV